MKIDSKNPVRKCYRDLRNGDVFQHPDIPLFYMKLARKKGVLWITVDLCTGALRATALDSEVIHYPDAVLTLGEAMRPKLIVGDKVQVVRSQCRKMMLRYFLKKGKIVGTVYRYNNIWSDWTVKISKDYYTFYRHELRKVKNV